jgi:cytoskeletal protein CcmA (bactofilin family)
MAIFSGGGPVSSSGESVTLIGGEAYFHGLLTVKGSLRVEGTVEGDIADATSVDVGKGGKVKGNIAAESLSVAGEVEGDVVASRQVELLASGRITGNIRSPKLRIEDGALFDGQCAMTSDSKHVSKSARAVSTHP